MEKEATIEEKIGIRKKEKAKKRGEINRRMKPGQPKRKKLRVEEGVADREEEPRRDKQSHKKRKVAIGEERQHKKQEPTTTSRNIFLARDGETRRQWGNS